MMEMMEGKKFRNDKVKKCFLLQWFQKLRKKDSTKRMHQMEEAREVIDLRCRESQDREEMEAQERESESRREFQAVKERLMLQLEEERKKVEKEKERCAEMEKRHQTFKRKWKKHCDVLVQKTVEKEDMLEEAMEEVEILKEITEQLKRKAQDMDPEMMAGLKYVDRKLKNFGPQCLQKKSTKTKLYFDSDFKGLELRECKSREAQSVEVIDFLVKESQVRYSSEKDLKNKLREINAREDMSEELEDLNDNTLQRRESDEPGIREELIALVKEKEEIRTTLQADKDSLELQLEEQRMKMEKERKSTELQYRQSEAREAQLKEVIEALVKLNDVMRQIFQADKQRMLLQLEQKSWKMEKDRERIEFQYRESKAREDQLREEFEALVKENHAMSHIFQAYKEHVALLVKNKEKEERARGT